MKKYFNKYIILVTIGLIVCISYNLMDKDALTDINLSYATRVKNFSILDDQVRVQTLSNNTRSKVMLMSSEDEVESLNETRYGFSYLKGIYLVDNLDIYNGTCELMSKETTSNEGMAIYYNKLVNGKIEKITKDENGDELKTYGVRYINESVVDGYILMQWYYKIDGVTYYTELYKRDCNLENSEVIVTDEDISSVNNKYSTSEEVIAPEDSIIITTNNYQVSLREYNSDIDIQGKVLKDISKKFVFTAPHSVKQLRDGEIKVADIRTGVMCEFLAKATNSVCISRKHYDATDPNYDDYEISIFQQFVVSLVNKLNSRLLIDIHGMTDEHGVEFLIGTGTNGSTLYSSDKCIVNSNLATSLVSYISDSNMKVGTQFYSNCAFNEIFNLVDTNTLFTGGSLIKNVFDNQNVDIFSSIQLEIANNYRVDTSLFAKTINAVTSFVNQYDFKDSDYTLSSLYINSNEIELSGDKVSYLYEVGEDVTSVSIDAILNSDKAIFVEGYGPRSIDLSDGENIFKLKVMAENEEVLTYYIIINKKITNIESNPKTGTSFISVFFITFVSIIVCFLVYGYYKRKIEENRVI